MRTNCMVNSMEEEAEHDAVEMRRHHELHGFGSGGGGGGGGGGVSGVTIGDNREPSQAAAADAADTAAGSDTANDAQMSAVAIPKERCKTLLALFCMLFGMLLTAISIAIVHDRVPDSDPLPDYGLELIANVQWALIACEVLLLGNMATAIAVSLLHRYRWVVLRRVFFIMGIVFAYRALTIVVTAMPDPNWRNKCDPKTNGSLAFVDLAKRVTRVAMGAGFSVNKTHNLCGDSIFSGHTASLTLSYLTIRQYTPTAARPLRWVSLLVCLASFVFLILSHSHYAVDLLIGYWLASRLWLICHTLADFPSQRRASGGHLMQIWWFPVFNFLEANVPGRLPCEMELPWRSGCFQRAYQRMGNIRMRLRGIMH